MHLVNNIDFKACRNRPIISAINNFAHIIHACIAGSVHFQHINMAAIGNILAMLADPARIQGWPASTIRTFTIQPPCQNSGGGCFADTAQTG